MVLCTNIVSLTERLGRHPSSLELLQHVRAVNASSSSSSAFNNSLSFVNATQQKYEDAKTISPISSPTSSMWKRCDKSKDSSFINVSDGDFDEEENDDGSTDDGSDVETAVTENWQDPSVPIEVSIYAPTIKGLDGFTNLSSLRAMTPSEKLKSAAMSDHPHQHCQHRHHHHHHHHTLVKAFRPILEGDEDEENDEDSNNCDFDCGYEDEHDGNDPYGNDPYGNDPYGNDPYGNDPYGNVAYEDDDDDNDDAEGAHVDADIEAWEQNIDTLNDENLKGENFLKELVDKEDVAYEDDEDDDLIVNEDNEEEVIYNNNDDYDDDDEEEEEDEAEDGEKEEEEEEGGGDNDDVDDYELDDDLDKDDLETKDLETKDLETKEENIMYVRPPRKFIIKLTHPDQEEHPDAEIIPQISRQETLVTIQENSQWIFDDPIDNEFQAQGNYHEHEFHARTTGPMSKSASSRYYIKFPSKANQQQQQEDEESQINV